MKKALSLILVFAFCMICLCACGGGSATRYNLTEVEFLGVTPDLYEYNYIEFNDANGTYVLENKVASNGVVTRQTGKFTVDANNNITFTNDQIPSMNYVLYAGEKATFNGNKLRVEATIEGFGDVYMVFTK